VADRVCAEVLSLPLYPALSDSAIAQVAAATRTLETNGT
jgi:dTDP-4-amino-4,6-dideoxygalactose transaminase